MPRGRKSRRQTQVNPLHQGILSKVIDAVYTVKKIENSKPDDFNKLMAFPDENKEFLSDLIAEVVTSFQIDHNLNPVPHFVNVKPFIDKHKTNILPKCVENTVTRVVVVSGTHEIFENLALSALPFNQGIFVSQGHAFKTLPSQGDLMYNDRDTYDKVKYPGKGIKRPHNRRLVIIDFVAKDSEAATKAVSEDVSKSGEKLVQESGPGLIQNLLKLFGK